MAIDESSFATIGQFNQFREEISKRQDVHERRQADYEKLCEEDRASLRGEVESLTTIVQRLEQKTDRQTDELLSPMKTSIAFIKKQSSGIFGDQRVKQAMIGAVLAMLSYVTYQLHTGMLQQPAQQIQTANPNPLPPTTIYPSAPVDAGTQ